MEKHVFPWREMVKTTYDNSNDNDGHKEYFSSKCSIFNNLQTGTPLPIIYTDDPCRAIDEK
ncbi:MAG: hypothetical protein KAQ71_13775 [Desulfobulbaceae bacterium]|nr:hypothetical protein [Desulfobulbaceae bacterium]